MDRQDPSLPGTELAALDFEALIGGPLVSAVHGQVQASLATVNFVKTIGFERTPYADISPFMQTTGKPAYVHFEYTKILPDGSPTQATLAVPFLTMLPIPTLRLDQVNIDFLAKINSVSTKQVDSTIALGADISGRADLMWASAQLRVSAVFQRNSKEGHSVSRDYSLGVKIKAVQDEMPAGLDRLLTILEGGIQELGQGGRPVAS